MLVPCERCRRHLRSTAAACPFCEAARRPSAEGDERVARLSRAGSVLLRMLLAQAPLGAACVGASAPPAAVVAPKTSVAPPASTSAVPASASAPSASASASHEPTGTVPIYGSNTLLVLHRVYFELGSVKIPKENDWLFEALVDIQKRFPLALITIQARAETAEGKDATARLELSKKRGEAILARLLAAGADPQRVKVEALSDGKPLSEGKSKEDRARNRSTSFGLTRLDGSPLDESDAGKTK